MVEAQRFVVYGAGAVGGVVGARLAQAGHEVELIARGAHLQAIAKGGLRVLSPQGDDTVHLAVHDSPARVDWDGQPIVLLGVKSQDTAGALVALSDAAPVTTPVVCLQNGVANEPAALRLFRNVYGVFVACPSTHLEPGVVVARSAPVTALLDIGRFPDGTDETCEAVARALGRSTIESLVRPDIMRWKRTKLLANLANAIGALCGPAQRGGRLHSLVRAEGVACYQAAGLDHASDQEDRDRRSDSLKMGPIPGHESTGDSSWQSLVRDTGSIEVDFLNGEIVLLGRLHGVPTPANELLWSLARQAARERWKPGAISVEELLGRLGVDD